MFFKTFDGLNLHFSDEGEGQPVLCLPGLTRNGSDFDDLAAALDRPVRLIRLTSRGRGKSDWSEDIMTYSVATEARDVVCLLDHLGLNKVTVIGTSRGGLIAMVLASIPETKARLAGVLLNDIGPELATDGLDRIMGYLGVSPKGNSYDDVAKALETTMSAEFPGVPLNRWRAHAERWFEETPTGIGLRYDPALRDAVIAQSAQPAPDLWPLFDALEGLPLGVLRGANSDLLSARTVDRMEERMPQMIARTVPDRGHVPFLDEPESLAVIHALLDQTKP